MEGIAKLLPFLLPIIAIELLLTLIAFTHVLTHKNYRFGSRGFWIFLSIFVQVIGPALYFVVGRKKEEKTIKKQSE
ncbi:MAG: PLDc N-terminal domain-containing protein [Eubacteriales bacterium]|nr:PLDc N-terminal domain-containing protein [Eubacteriales bacterium]